MSEEPRTVETILGTVLVGGGSRRMGRDKAMIELEGQTLLERAVRVLQRVLTEVVISGPERSGYLEYGVAVVPDLRPDLGPLGGIHTALIQARGRPVFVLACDLPFVTADLVRWMAGVDTDDGCLFPDRSLPSGSLVRIVRDENGVQPLCGLYTANCLSPVEDALDQGRLSVSMLVQSLDTEYLEIDKDAEWYDPKLLANLNSTEDLEASGIRGGLKL